MQKIEFTPSGVCARSMEIEVEDGKIKRLNVNGGCSGNLQGIAKLVEGMNCEEVITRLDGVKCGTKSSSCPEQLAIALKNLNN